MKELLWLIVIVVAAIMKVTSNEKKKTTNRRINSSGQWTPMSKDSTINKSVTQVQQRVNETIQKTMQTYAPKDIIKEAQRSFDTYSDQRMKNNRNKVYTNPYENAGKNTQKTKAFGESIIEKNVKKQFEQEEFTHKDVKVTVNTDLTELNMVNIPNEYLFPQVRIGENLKDIETILICGYPMDTFLKATDAPFLDSI